MKNIVEAYLQQFLRDRRARRRSGSVLAVLAVVVAVCVAWGLHFDGIAMSNEVVCGMEEHTHVESCYDDGGELTCGMEEHVHTVECLGVDSASEGQMISEDTTYEVTDVQTGAKVSVSAPAGALPASAELQVDVLDESSEAYEAAATAVELDSETEMLALDIRFVTDGEEVEPTAAVEVTIDASSVVPDGVDASTLVVNHLEEKDGSSELSPVLVADATDDTEGTIDVEAVAATFKVESFSNFTVQWSANTNDSNTISVTTYFGDVDASANGDYTADASLGPSSLTVGYDNEVDFDDNNELLAVSGYTLDHAVLTVSYRRWSGTTTNTYTATSVRATYNWSSGSWTYQYRDSSGNWNTFNTGSNYTVSVALYYKKQSAEVTGNLSITDTISSDGQLEATYNVTDPSDEDYISAEDLADPNKYTYKWFKSEDGTTYTELTGQITSEVDVYGDGARCYYYAQLVRVSDNTVVAQTDTYQVPYYNELRNGGFEEPAVSGSAQLTNGLYDELVWKTTGLGAYNTSKQATGQDIEIVNAAQAGSSYGETHAAGGNQYAELNAEYAGTLYQDVLTVPGSPLYWSVSHEGRSGYDRMAVIAVDSAFAEKYITTQAQVDAVVAASGISASSITGDGQISDAVTFTYTVGGESTTITVWVMGSDADGWNEFEGTYTVPDSQYLTRLMFGAVSTATGDNTVGNLIDYVHFSQDYVPATNTSGIRVTKDVEGIADGVTIAAGTFKFDLYTASGTYVSTVAIPVVDATVGSTFANWNATFTNLTPGSYYVVEESTGSVIGGYEVQSTESLIDYDGATASDGSKSGNFTASSGSVAHVTFTNTYVGKTSFMLQKVDKDGTTTLSGAEFELMTASNEAVVLTESTVDGVPTYTFASASEDATPTTITAGKVNLAGLPDGAYSLTEASAPDGYNRLTSSITLTVAGGTVALDSTVDASDASLEYDETTGTYTLVIRNIPGAVLPQTGGSGTSVYMAMGFSLCTGAAYLLYRKFGRERRASLF